MGASSKPAPYEQERFQAFGSGPLHWVERFFFRQRRVLLISYLIFLFLVENSLRRPRTPWYNVAAILYVVYVIVLEIWSHAGKHYHTTFWRIIRTQIHLVIATLLFALSGASSWSYLVYLPWLASTAIYFRPGAGFPIAAETAVLALAVFWRYGQVLPAEFWFRGTLLVLGLIGTYFFTLYLWQRWIGERQARDRYRDTLRQVGNTITAAVGLDRTFETIFDLTRNLIPFETALILGWSPKDALLFPRAQRGYASDFLRDRGFTFRLDQGLTGLVASSREPLLVRDVQHETPVSPLHSDIGVGKPLRSFLVVPLLFGGDLLGVFELTSHRPDAFDEDHLEALKGLADQISIAIHHAELEEKLKKELDQASALHQLSVQATSRLDALGDLLSLILDTALQLTNCSQGWISLVEGEDGRLKVQVARSVPDEQWHVLKPGQGITGWVVKFGRPLCVLDVRMPIHVDGVDVQPEYHEFIPTTQSELCVPLTLGSRVLGVLNVESPQVGAFDERDLTLLETLASQAIVFIHRARLLRDAHLQLGELRNLHEISLALADPNLDVRALLQKIPERAVTLLGAQGGGMLLAYPDERELKMAFTHNLDVMRGFTCKYGEGMAGRVVESGKTLIVNDYQNWDHRIPDLGEELYLGLIKAAIHVPLKWRDKVVGVLFVSDNRDGKTFYQGDQRLLERLANLAALAIGNTRERSYLQQLVSSSPDAIVAVDRKGCITQFNESSQSVFGLERGDVIGQHVSQYYYGGEEDARKINHMLFDAGDKGIRNHPTYARGRGSEKIPILLSGALLRDEVGRRIGSFGILTDLRDDAELRDSQHKSRFLQALEHYPQDKLVTNLSDLRKCLVGQLEAVRTFYDTQYLCHIQYLILFASVKEDDTVLPAIAWVGLPPHIGNALPHFNWRKARLQPLEGDRQKILEYEADLIAGWMLGAELRQMLSDGIRGGRAEFFADAACLLPLRLADNYRSVLVFGPFTGEVDLMKEKGFLKNVNLAVGTSALSWLQTLYLRGAQKEAETSVKLIVHRMRMNLTQINGKFGLIKRLTREQPSIYQTARGGEDLVAHLARSATRALTSGVVDMEPEDYEFQPYSLATLVQNCVEIFREHAREENRELRIDPTVENLPYAEVDPTFLLIALANIIDNALKYSFEHTYVQVSAEYDTQIARIIVDDLGEQLPEAAQVNLRESGRRWAVSARARRIPGMGLGLWEASVIAGVHGGVVDFTSVPVPERGEMAHHVRVWVELPLRRPWVR